MGRLSRMVRGIAAAGLLALAPGALAGAAGAAGPSEADCLAQARALQAEAVERLSQARASKSGADTDAGLERLAIAERILTRLGPAGEAAREEVTGLIFWTHRMLTLKSAGGRKTFPPPRSAAEGLDRAKAAAGRGEREKLLAAGNYLETAQMFPGSAPAEEALAAWRERYAGSVSTEAARLEPPPPPPATGAAPRGGAAPGLKFPSPEGGDILDRLLAQMGRKPPPASAPPKASARPVAAPPPPLPPGEDPISRAIGDRPRVRTTVRRVAPIDEASFEITDAVAARLERGLAGEYFASAEPGDEAKLRLSCVDANVDNDWSRELPEKSLGPGAWSVRWTGFLDVPA